MIYPVPPKGATGATGPAGATGATGATGAAGPATAHVIFTIAATGGIDVWTNQPSATTEFPGSTARRVQADLQRATEGRLSVNMGVAGASGSTLAAQYSTDGGSTWAYLDGSAGPTVAISAVDNAVGSWVNLASGAKADVLLRLVGAGGNATADPSFRRVCLETR